MRIKLRQPQLGVGNRKEQQDKGKRRTIELEENWLTNTLAIAKTLVSRKRKERSCMHGLTKIEVMWELIETLLLPLSCIIVKIFEPIFSLFFKILA